MKNGHWTLPCDLTERTGKIIRKCAERMPDKKLQKENKKKRRRAAPPFFAFLEIPEGVFKNLPIRASVKAPRDSKVEACDSPVNSTLLRSLLVSLVSIIIN